MRGVRAQVYESGRRLALGASATAAHWIGGACWFALGDGSVLIAPREGETRRITAHEGAILCAAAHPDGRGLLTGGDISPDGTRAALCDYLAGYELVLPKGDPNFDDIWKQTPTRFDIGQRETGESIAYSADGLEIFAGSEGKHSPIYEMRRK